MALLTVSLLGLAIATPRSRLLTLDLDGHAFHFQAGQAVMMGPHGSSDRRPFSIANAPDGAATARQLELLIAADIGTDLSWASPGALVDIDGPIGTFTYDNAPAQPHVLFVAGGVGIAPLRSMMHQALHVSPAPTITLLYSARRSDEFAFIEEFQAHARSGRITLHQTVTRHDGDDWQGRRGRVGRGEFEAVLQHPTATTCFVCGPNALVTETVETLKALGVPDGLVRIEQWGR
ncbi:MAG: FAD-dependent oxidoreductase [Vicinamibacterales bacterium]